MAGHSPFYSPTSQQNLHTPSPLALSLASSVGFSSQPATLNTSNLLLRSFTFIFSAVAALSLAAPTPDVRSREWRQRSFHQIPEFRYAFWVAILVSFYSASQLSKSICDLAFQWRVISDKAYDYITFFTDQVAGYLLISSSSVAVSATDHLLPGRMKKAAIASVCLSFAAFGPMAACILVSGFKLCKRVIW